MENLMDFQTALNSLIADLTPQPWDYTTPDGVTLTVIPAGLREAPGQAEVYVRITVDKTRAAEAAITTSVLPALIDAIEANEPFEHEPRWGTDSLRVIPTPAGPVLLVTEDDHRDGAWHTESVTINLPETQRLPLASALRRALDVARGWEDVDEHDDCDDCTGIHRSSDGYRDCDGNPI